MVITLSLIKLRLQNLVDNQNIGHLAILFKFSMRRSGVVLAKDFMCTSSRSHG
jgi:hypothetical protein